LQIIGVESKFVLKELTINNAKAEEVAERIEVHYADARDLPFPDHHFDVVVSSLALHNIKNGS
jgi:ubiquinone/menaquinone biosynthesis C-methylase UbiE